MSRAPGRRAPRRRFPALRQRIAAIWPCLSATTPPAEWPAAAEGDLAAGETLVLEAGK